MKAELSVMEEREEEEVTKEEKEDLYSRVQELKSSQAAVLAEIDLFECFISRSDPQDRGSQAGGDGLGSQLEGGGRGRRRRSRSHVSHHLQQLTLEQKLYVAQREVKETQQDQEKLRQRCERVQDHYKVTLKEAEMRLSDIRKAQKEFERRLLRPVKETRLGMKEPEKVTQLEKFHVKNQALKVQERRLQQQLIQKREAGRADYEDIFQEFDEQRTEKNLDELQVNNLKVQRALSAQKEKLQKVTQQSTELSSDITNRKQTLARIEEEIQQAEEDRLKAEALNQHLRGLIADYQAPGVMEYILIKNKHKKLQRSIHTLERKVGITEMALKAHSRAVNTQRATFTPANSVNVGAGSVQRRIPEKLPHIAEHGT
ncbi:coiled-coil domain-containing protein 113 isoform X2 [Cheilinus undulatus]|uniref:coiled-coil domain-containing protein 113 isoform X2 n=1 Tax=Cheilinus undulatus TaxID=241271 RepID=UPI001BD3FB1F|nr:coiled-coil domain-containing protein 113 isoform X2 [Cheilinus undulatus]